MRGITLEEIAEATKIGSRALRALEHEDFAKLPGGIFNKGFVRSYARYLGINEEQAVADFLSAETASQQAQAEESGVQVPLRRPGSLRWVPLVVIAAAVLLFVGWRVWVRVSAPPPPAPLPRVTGSVVIQRVPTAAVPAIAEAAPAALQPAEFVVQVRAREDSWISVSADGKVLIADDVLRASSEQTFRAREQMVVKLGNVAGVDISYNGQPLQVPAGANVRTFTFTPAGVQ